MQDSDAARIHSDMSAMQLSVSRAHADRDADGVTGQITVIAIQKSKYSIITLSEDTP
jgi:hypothetical protein